MQFLTENRDQKNETDASRKKDIHPTNRLIMTKFVSGI